MKNLDFLIFHRKFEHANKIWISLFKRKTKLMKTIKVSSKIKFRIFEIFIVKMNMQKALALQIQEITQELRMQQKNMLDNLNKFQSSKKNAFDFQFNENNNVKTSNSRHLQQFETQVL